MKTLSVPNALSPLRCKLYFPLSHERHRLKLYPPRIEHLSPDVFEAFAPMLLGVYHPKFLLITTPSYTFNARFTVPDAPASSRQGHPDPTGRTDRIFRHNDHKFEWTDEELRAWSSNVAQQWGYKATVSNLGQPTLADPFERQFLGASQAVLFQRCDDDVAWRSEEGRKVVESLALKTQPHTLLAEGKLLSSYLLR
jgi:hypothetical protein